VPNKHYQAIFLAPLPGIEEEEEPMSTTRSHVNYAPTSNFSGAVAWEKEDFCKGSPSLPIFYFFIVFLIFFTLFFFASFLSKIQKISSFIVVIFTCLLLVLLEWVLLRTPSCVILLAPITMILSALLLRHLLLRQIFMRLNLLC
jgi:hypothetical protein